MRTLFCFYFLFSIFFFFGLALCGILVPSPGLEPEPPALEGWNLYHKGNSALFFKKMFNLLFFLNLFLLVGC